VLLLTAPLAALSQVSPDSPPKPELKKLSLDELLNLEVFSVSRKATKFTESAAGIEVITHDMIRRSGVTNLPDVLRLAAGVQVASSDGHTWAISARGFNGTAANKLQVLLDGRSLYTPLYSGVFWDVQDTLLEDIDRIEIIRGPGATMWGANAVNGVINIITKSAKETQGALITGGAGSEEKVFGGVRFGGKLGDRTSYRTYIKYFDRGALSFSNGRDSSDSSKMDQGGFRIDSELTDDSSLTVQGDLNTGRLAKLSSPDTVVGGGNVLARWNRRFSPGSDLQIQFYYDRVDRNTPRSFKEGRNTYDLDLQYRIPSTARHDLIIGGNYRLSSDLIGNTATLAFIPDHRSLRLMSGFLQDEIKLGEEVGLTLGSKFEHNTLSGFEVQPSVRLAWYPGARQTVWGAVSRAVRTPSRIDADLQAFTPTGVLLLRGDPDFRSEKALAHELGYRIQPHPKVSFDLATFYNSYNDLRSLEPQLPAGLPIVFGNNLTAKTYGTELTANIELTRWWRLTAGHSYLQTNFSLKAESRATGTASEGNDPKHMFTAHSSMNLPARLELDLFLRYVAQLPHPLVPGYKVMDFRLGRTFGNLELSLAGRNLLDRQHPEFGAQTFTSKEVQRSILGKIAWCF
jgi:iron complex outermembrane receptor protein